MKQIEIEFFKYSVLKWIWEILHAFYVTFKNALKFASAHVFLIGILDYNRNISLISYVFMYL